MSNALAANGPNCYRQCGPWTARRSDHRTGDGQSAWHRGGVFAMVLCCFVLTIPAWSSETHAEVALYEGDRIKIDFAVDAKAVVFLQDNPWFGEAVANIGADTDTWAEFAIEPAIYLTFNRVLGGELFGGFSGVGTKNFGESADGLSVGFDNPEEATLELAYGGWRRDFGEDISLEALGGNFDYQIGTGFLIIDGGADGGNRGGFYLGARSSGRAGALVRLTVGNLLAEGFYIGNNPRREGIRGEVAGGNLEYDFSGWAKIGATFLQVVDIDNPEPGDLRDKLRTYDFRAEASPIDNLTLSGELALQRGGDIFDGEGWWVQAHYAFGHVPFQPTLTYRYAVVTGDDPATPDDEGFEPLAYGFTDYEQWYQGEITGNWIFSNTNQRTHLIKGSAALTDRLTLTGAWLNIQLDEPAELGVSSDNFGNEINVFLDWSVNDHLFLSAAAATLFPGDGAEQFTGGDRTWSHFMFYASVSY